MREGDSRSRIRARPPQETALIHRSRDAMRSYGETLDRGDDGCDHDEDVEQQTSWGRMFFVPLSFVGRVAVRAVKEGDAGSRGDVEHPCSKEWILERLVRTRLEHQRQAFPKPQPSTMRPRRTIEEAEATRFDRSGGVQGRSPCPISSERARRPWPTEASSSRPRKGDRTSKGFRQAEQPAPQTL